MKRWSVNINYLDGSLEHHEIEELEELQEIVEHGHEFSAIKDIVIKYNLGIKNNTNTPPVAFKEYIDLATGEDVLLWNKSFGDS